MSFRSHRRHNDVATATNCEDNAKAPNLCDPQPTVEIYISNPHDPNAQDEVTSAVAAETSTTTLLDAQHTSKSQLPKFTIHKTLLCFHSQFFAKAFNSKFKEGIIQEMTLDIDVKAFGVFTNWLYTQSIVDSSGGAPNVDVLANLWIFAERILHPKLQNQVMTCLHGTLYSGKFDKKAFYTFCNIADRHADSDSCLLDLAATVLTWSPPSKVQDEDMYLIPRSVLAKSWQSFKEAQTHDMRMPCKVKRYLVKVADEGK